MNFMSIQSYLALSSFSPFLFLTYSLDTFLGIECRYKKILLYSFAIISFFIVTHIIEEERDNLFKLCAF